MPKIHLTEAFIAGLPPSGKKIDHFDAGMPGLILRQNAGGRLTWCALHYVRRVGKDGKPRTIPTTKRIGRWPKLGVKAARQLAKKFDPQAARKGEAPSFQQIAETWIREHVDEKRLRTKPEIVRQLTKYVYPFWKDRAITELRRLDVHQLLDGIKSKHGRVQADAVMSTLRSIMQWYEDNMGDEDFRVPITKSMKRDKRSAVEKARRRTFDHDEIISNGSVRLEYRDRGEVKAFWKACGKIGAYGVLAKLLLLTGQRRRKVAQMEWEDIDAEGVWTIRTEKGEKGTAEKIQLPQLARDLLASLPRVNGNSYVFPAARGYGPMHSFSDLKAAIDGQLPKTMRPWVLHDLRRTARSMLARIGTPDQIAERILGHQLQGVLAVYNRHDYFVEKSQALQQLADLVEDILSGKPVTNGSVSNGPVSNRRRKSGGTV